MVGTERGVLESTLDVFDGDPPTSTPLTTSEVAEELGITRRSAYERMDRLVEQDALETKKVGARGRVWWRPPATDATGSKEQTDRPEHRQRGLETELEEVFDRIDDAFFALDGDWEFTYVNERAEELIDNPEDELLGRSVWEAYPEARGTAFEENYQHAMAEQEPVQFETFYPPLDEWFEVNAYPSETGLSVYFRDVTGRVEREQELEQYETLVETVDDGLYTVDSDGRFVLVNDAFCEIVGWEREELLGQPASAVYWGETIDRDPTELVRQLAAGERETARIEVDLDVIGGEAVPVEVTLRPLEFTDGLGRCGAVRDVTERLERERQLAESEHRYRALAEHFPNGAVGIVDENLEYTLVDGQFFDDIDVDPSTVQGRRSDAVFPAATADRLESAYRDALDGDTSTLEVEHGKYSFEVWVAPLTGEDGDVFAAMVMAQDITERVQWENELQDRERALRRAYKVISDTELSFDEQVNELLRIGRDVVGTDFATFSRINEDQDEYVFEAVAAPDDVDLRAGDSASLASLPNCAHVAETERTLVLRDVEAEAPELADPTWGISCYIGAPVVVEDGVYGTFCFYGMDARSEEFSDWEVTFVDLLCSWVTYELNRQQITEWLEALNDLDGVVREIIDAVIDQSTREEIEEAVCERLAAADSYLFAWIGDDTGGQTVNPRAEAGTEGYLDDVTISVDPDDERGRGPTGRALRTGEIQVANDILENDQHDPWQDPVEEYGIRSSAAIPIVHEETIYGVLNVYADRRDAFSGEEREMIGQLGEVVGHAIAAVERKRALTSDEIVELEFRIPDAFEELGTSAVTNEPISFDRSIPLEDDQYLLYGETSEEGMTAIETIVDGFPHWREVEVIDEQFGDCKFEVLLSEPPFISVVAAHGGTVESAAVEDGDLGMTVHLQRGTDVQKLITAVQDVFPAATAVARRQISRSSDPSQRIKGAWIDELTDRQRTVLETAYFAGYFEWPRDSSGEDIAATLDISSATVSQHLRSAESKLFGALFEELPADG